MQRLTRKGGGKEERERKARAAARRSMEFNTITDISKSEKTAGDLTAESMVGFVRSIKGSIYRPNSSQISEISSELLPGVDLSKIIRDNNQFDEEVNNENEVHDYMFKTVISTLLNNMIDVEEKKNGGNSLLTTIKEDLERMRQSERPINPDMFSTFFKSRLGDQEKRLSGGGFLAEFVESWRPASMPKPDVYVTPHATVTPTMEPIQTTKLPSNNPAYTVNSSQEIYNPAETPSYSPTEQPYFQTQSSQSNSSKTKKQSQNNSKEENSTSSNNSSKTKKINILNNESSEKLTTRAPYFENETGLTEYTERAERILKGKPVQSSRLAPSQMIGLMIDNALYGWSKSTISLYSPFKQVAPLVSDEMKAKFGFIKDEMEKLQLRMAKKSPERWHGLQYNSIVNILQMIRLGETILVSSEPLSQLVGRTQVERPDDIYSYMLRIANYDRNIQDIKIYIKRTALTFADATKSFFGRDANYGIDKIIIMFNVVAGKNTVNNYITFNSIEIDNGFKPFAARFIMPRVGNVEQVIDSIDKVLKLQASIIGFWHPSTSTAAIIANLKATNAVTKDIMSQVGRFSEIAFKLTELKMKDFLISGLYQTAIEPSNAIEIRLKSYQLQNSIIALAQSDEGFDVGSTQKLVALASDLAASSKQLEKVFKNEEALSEFIGNMTSSLTSSLATVMEAATDTVKLAAKSTKRAVNAGEGLSSILIRQEIMFIYFTFLFYFIVYGNAIQKAIFFFMPFLYPIGPIIAMESALKGVAGIEPNSMTTILMLYLIMRIWDKEKVAPIGNYVMELLGMGQAARAGIPIANPAADLPRNAAAANVAPVGRRRRNNNNNAALEPGQALAAPEPGQGGRRTKKRNPKKVRSTRKHHHRR